MSDPCEKETIDALGTVSMQEREDLTASAQVRHTFLMVLSLLLFYPFYPWCESVFVFSLTLGYKAQMMSRFYLTLAGGKN